MKLLLLQIIDEKNNSQVTTWQVVVYFYVGRIRLWQ